MSLTPNPSFVSSRLDTAIATLSFDQPTLVLDPDVVAHNYHALKQGLRGAIHYAVKANPHPAFISRLIALGSHFDAASKGEIDLCLSLGAHPDTISFGNTIKRARDIAYAHSVGIKLFACDAPSELEKIATHAPGAQVYVRLLVDACHADWPLTRKFGCDEETALHLLDMAKSLDVSIVGFSFHVGSQTRQAAMWDTPLAQISRTWKAAQAAGHTLRVLNIGGGFPAFYEHTIDTLDAYARDVMALIDTHFGPIEHIMAEPGRGLVADAGVICAEVLLVSKKTANDLHRWVYLDVGRFSGLAETEGEAIRYTLATALDGTPTGPCILAGPSCDSADVLYEKRPVHLPLALKEGDRVVLRNCGAYTSTYSSVGFNGFDPLNVIAL